MLQKTETSSIFASQDRAALSFQANQLPGNFIPSSSPRRRRCSAPPLHPASLSCCAAAPPCFLELLHRAPQASPTILFLQAVTVPIYSGDRCATPPLCPGSPSCGGEHACALCRAPRLLDRRRSVPLPRPPADADKLPLGPPLPQIDATVGAAAPPPRPQA